MTADLCPRCYGNGPGPGGTCSWCRPPTPDLFASVLGELAAEHGNAVAVHGFDAEHDARHSDADWAWRLLRRVSEVLAPETIVPSTPAERRRAFVELAHIAASAVAAHDLRHAHPSETTDAQRITALAHAVTGRPMANTKTITSTDTSWRYVTRPGESTVERHTLTCTRWKDEADPCPGQTGCWPTADHHPEEPPT